jgi:3-phenylpropionate/cinnamic acid dioxygenase small subunit
MTPRNDEIDRVPAQLASILDVESTTLADRLAILQLISAYSHWVDDFDPEQWGRLFTDDASFEIRFARGEGGAIPTLVGRQAILDVILPRQESFRKRGIQRRHYLTNPIVAELQRDSARVMAYLMLASIEPESGLSIAGTGRYDGLVVRGPSGWRIQRWRMTADGSGITGIGGAASASAPDQ